VVAVHGHLARAHLRCGADPAPRVCAARAEFHVSAGEAAGLGHDGALCLCAASELCDEYGCYPGECGRDSWAWWASRVLVAQCSCGVDERGVGGDVGDCGLGLKCEG